MPQSHYFLLTVDGDPSEPPSAPDPVVPAAAAATALGRGPATLHRIPQDTRPYDSWGDSLMSDNQNFK